MASESDTTYATSRHAASDSALSELRTRLRADDRDPDQFLREAKEAVRRADAEKYQDGRGTRFDAEDLFVVWFCKTLQHWKALVSTNVVDGLYWEVTHNGDTDDDYVDEYVKTRNTSV